MYFKARNSNVVALIYYLPLEVSHKHTTQIKEHNVVNKIFVILTNGDVAEL